MSLQATIYLVVGLTFALYIGIAIWSRAGSTSDFYVAGSGVHPVLNGMATGADWMSAASFISMAGLIAGMGYGGSLFLMGWTGGYCLLAMLLAPYLRKFGKYTVPQFVGDRYYSKGASAVAVICLIIASTTYIIGQMTGVGVAFSRFLGVSNTTDFIRGHRTGPITGRATPIHQGRSQQLWQVDITRDEDGNATSTPGTSARPATAPRPTTWSRPLPSCRERARRPTSSRCASTSPR